MVTPPVLPSSVRSKELGEFLRLAAGSAEPDRCGVSRHGSTQGARAPARGGVLDRRSGRVMARRLEQGRGAFRVADVLEALAHALRLDETERCHSSPGGLHTDHRDAPHAQAHGHCACSSTSSTPTPVLARRTWNIVLGRRQSRAVPWMAPTHEPGANLLELVFEDADLQRLMVDHDEECVRLVSQLRLHARNGRTTLNSPTSRAVEARSTPLRRQCGKQRTSPRS